MIVRMRAAYAPSALCGVAFCIAMLSLRAPALGDPLYWLRIQEQKSEKSAIPRSIDQETKAQSQPSTTPSASPASRPFPHTANRASAGATPSSVDLRPRLLELGFPPRPQGARGTCSIFTTCGAIEVALALQSGSPRRLSPEFLNWAAGQAGGRPSDGNFFHNALAGFERHGICAEKSMPYRPTFDAAGAPTSAALAEAKEFLEHARSEIAVRWIIPWTPDRFGVNDEQFAQIKQAIALGYPVAAGSGHSRLLVGFRDDAEKAGGGIFITEDSALNRFDEVTYEFVRKEVADVFWIEAMQPKKAPGPTPQPQINTK